MEFSKLIRENLIRKYSTFNSVSINPNFEIVPIEYEKTSLLSLLTKILLLKVGMEDLKL